MKIKINSLNSCRKEIWFIFRRFWWYFNSYTDVVKKSPNILECLRKMLCFNDMEGHRLPRESIIGHQWQWAIPLGHYNKFLFFLSPFPIYSMVDGEHLRIFSWGLLQCSKSLFRDRLLIQQIPISLEDELRFLTDPTYTALSIDMPSLFLFHEKMTLPYQTSIKKWFPKSIMISRWFLEIYRHFLVLSN